MNADYSNADYGRLFQPTCDVQIPINKLLTCMALSDVCAGVDVRGVCSAGSEWMMSCLSR